MTTIIRGERTNHWGGMRPTVDGSGWQKLIRLASVRQSTDSITTIFQWPHEFSGPTGMNERSKRAITKSKWLNMNMRIKHVELFFQHRLHIVGDAVRVLSSERGIYRDDGVDTGE